MNIKTKMLVVVSPLVLLTCLNSVTNVHAEQLSNFNELKKIVSTNYPKISGMTYDSNSGQLTGKIPNGAVSYTVKIDGNKYNETFSISGSNFTSHVSDDFYHTVKFSKHTVEVTAYDNQKQIIAVGDLESKDFGVNANYPKISGMTYDSNSGQLTGKIPNGAVSYTVKIDGNKYNETISISGSNFTSHVSDDFYHTVKFGKHTVEVTAYDNQKQIIAVGQLSLDK